MGGYISGGTINFPVLEPKAWIGTSRKKTEQTYTYANLNARCSLTWWVGTLISISVRSIQIISSHALRS